MQDVFGSDGKFGMLTLQRGDGSAGLIELQGLNTGEADNKTVMLISANVGTKIAVDPVDALGDKHVLDVFGPVFQPIQIRGLIYVQSCQGDPGIGIIQVEQFFAANRVDTNKSGVNLSYGNFKKRVYPYELIFGDADPSRQTVTFVINTIGKPRKSS